VQIKCTRICKCRNNTCWNCLRNWGQEGQGKWQRRRFQIWYIWYIVRTFVNVNVTMTSTQHNNKGDKRLTRNPKCIVFTIITIILLLLLLHVCLWKEKYFLYIATRERGERNKELRSCPYFYKLWIDWKATVYEKDKNYCQDIIGNIKESSGSQIIERERKL
jgi:hypothetical protein